MKIGEKLPHFTFITNKTQQKHFSDYQNQWLVIYFYPRDATPGCTREGQNFRDAYSAFQALGADIVGISRDSIKAHEKFACEQQFPFELISDQDETLCRWFDVIKTKSMYGKQVQGIERSTFLADKTGVIRHIWRGVKVPDHVDEVLNTLKRISS